MGAIHVQIDDALDKEFRLEVVRRMGSRKGSLKLAIEEAIKSWLEKT